MKIQNNGNETVDRDGTANLAELDGNLPPSSERRSGARAGELSWRSAGGLVAHLNGRVARSTRSAWLALLALAFLASLCGGAGGSASAQCLDPSFAAARMFPANVTPRSVVVGDFNKDGFPDVAVGNHLSGQLSILLGKGNGSFQDVVGYNDGLYGAITGIALADFDGDGNADVVAAHQNASSSVTIFKGVADGTFLVRSNYDTGGSWPSAVAVGDLNGDGKPDVIVVNQFSNDVSVLLGNGDDSLQPAVIYGTLGLSPVAIEVSDLNGDGKLDVIVVNQGSADISVLLGNGNGTLQTATTYGAGTSPSAVAVGELNGDGKIDLVVADAGNSFGGVPSGFVMLLGKGDGSFQYPSNFLAGVTPNGVKIYDFNHDGKADIALANIGGGFGGAPSGLSIVLGNGNGTFGPETMFPAGLSTWSLAVADLNGDGEADVVLGNASLDKISVLTGLGGGNFLVAPKVSTTSFSRAVALADFNEDGRADLASSETWDMIAIRLGNGDGSFQSVSNYLTGVLPMALDTADFNADGHADVATANRITGDVSLLLGNGDGTFQPTLNSPAGLTPMALAFGDFNHDGKLDLAVVLQDTNQVAVLLGNGDGTFQPPAPYDAGLAPTSVTVGDFNDDHHADLAVVNSGSANVSILFGNGNGTFQPAMNLSVDPGLYSSVPFSVAASDLNGDGVSDLAVSNQGSYLPTPLSVFLSNGNGTFQAQVNYGLGSSLGPIAIRDFNGDGKVDVALGASVAFGNGDGTFQSFALFDTGSAGYGVQRFAVADLNGDARLDMVVTDPFATISVLLNTCAPSAVSTTTSVTPAAGQYSDIVTLNALIAPAIARGMVQFSIDGSAVGVAPVAGGVAALPWPISASAGSHVIQADFTSSDPAYASSAGTSVLTVSLEDATAAPDPTNPSVVSVNSRGGIVRPRHAAGHDHGMAKRRGANRRHRGVAWQHLQCRACDCPTHTGWSGSHAHGDGDPGGNLRWHFLDRGRHVRFGAGQPLRRLVQHWRQLLHRQRAFGVGSHRSFVRFHQRCWHDHQPAHWPKRQL